MKEKFKLDFNIYSSEDRVKAIKNLPLEELTNSELETISNYILYGKDAEGLSQVDTRDIYIKAKFNSYQRDRTVSLNELMETPGFDEQIFNKNRVIYKKAKFGIDKEKSIRIPGMVELWAEIDKLQKILDENTGKRKRSKDGLKLSKKEIYYLTHYLIQLRTQQYYLWDSRFESLQAKKNKGEFHDNPIDSQANYPIMPRGVMRYERDLIFEEPRHDHFNTFDSYTEDKTQEIYQSGKPYFDFRIKEHVYQLIQYYTEIWDYVRNQPDSMLNNLLWTLDFYVRKANLSKVQNRIVELKKTRYSNQEISEILHKEFGTTYQENYISTIWNKIVRQIVEAVELNFDEYLCKDYDKAWKKCSKCGRELLRDSRNFVKKSRALDGLTNQCKRCDKIIRLKKKELRNVVWPAQQKIEAPQGT